MIILLISELMTSEISDNINNFAHLSLAYFRNEINGTIDQIMSMSTDNSFNETNATLNVTEKLSFFIFSIK